METTTALIPAGVPTAAALLGIVIDARAIAKSRQEHQRWIAKMDSSTSAIEEKTRAIRATLGAS